MMCKYLHALDSRTGVAPHDRFCPLSESATVAGSDFCHHVNGRFCLIMRILSPAFGVSPVAVPIASSCSLYSTLLRLEEIFSDSLRLHFILPRKSLFRCRPNLNPALFPKPVPWLNRTCVKQFLLSPSSIDFKTGRINAQT